MVRPGSVGTVVELEVQVNTAVSPSLTVVDVGEIIGLVGLSAMIKR